MILTVRILTLLLLVLIAVQDFKSRCVYWIIFPVLTLLFLIERVARAESLRVIFFHSAYNILFVAIQLLLLTIYFSVKNRQWVNLTANMLGWGDILFLGALAFALSFAYFLLFYVASLMASLLLWIPFQSLTKRDSTIPLAGLQSAWLLFFLIVAWGLRWDTSGTPTFLNAITG